MSAWMVSDAHVDLLATAYLAFVDPKADPQMIGMTFLEANAVSIHARYGKDEQADAQVDEYVYRRWEGKMDPALVAKQIACLDYQSCEFEAWPTSASRQLLDKLEMKMPDQDRAVRRDDLPWGVDEHPGDTQTERN